MRPSLRKGADAALSRAEWQEIRVRSGRDDKGEGSASLQIRYWDDEQQDPPLRFAPVGMTLRLGTDKRSCWTEGVLATRRLFLGGKQQDPPRSSGGSCCFRNFRLASPSSRSRSAQPVPVRCDGRGLRLSIPGRSCPGDQREMYCAW